MNYLQNVHILISGRLDLKGLTRVKEGRAHYRAQIERESILRYTCYKPEESPNKKNKIQRQIGLFFLYVTHKVREVADEQNPQPYSSDIVADYKY